MGQGCLYFAQPNSVKVRTPNMYTIANKLLATGFWSLPGLLVSQSFTYALQ